MFDYWRILFFEFFWQVALLVIYWNQKFHNCWDIAMYKLSVYWVYLTHCVYEISPTILCIVYIFTEISYREKYVICPDLFTISRRFYMSHNSILEITVKVQALWWYVQNKILKNFIFINVIVVFMIQVCNYVLLRIAQRCTTRKSSCVNARGIPPAM